MKTLLTAWVLAATVGGVILLAQAPAFIFAYDRRWPAGLVAGGTEERGAAAVTDLTYQTLTGARRAAYLVTPTKAAAGPRPAILFVHWYEPPNPTSSRGQFLPDAVELAGEGVISLLVDTMWSDPDWFRNRDPENDLGHSIEQVKELRRALDILVSRPGVARSDPPPAECRCAAGAVPVRDSRQVRGESRRRGRGRQRGRSEGRAVV